MDAGGLPALETDAGTLVDESLRHLLAAPPDDVNLDRLDAVTTVLADLVELDALLERSEGTAKPS